ncbi:hypothetical protein J437_LFUL008023 [Ladona fulva]|uniref:Peptidase S1 domain-containing protein n=1 Tax=Ladona fulva TaxID=123851 RepID=A0A8K0KK88_LADFU|nr:hypothetical protein J437_LFUL008023 [Ladona fulva]
MDGYYLRKKLNRILNLLSDSPGISDQLRYVSMPVMPNDKCSQVYGDVITDSKICTDTTGGRSSCNGDSGGPLVLMMNDGRYTEAYDFSKLRPATKGVSVNPRYTASQWKQIFANQKLKPEVYPGYKKGTVRAPGTHWKNNLEILFGFDFSGHGNAGLAVHHDTRVVGGQVASHGQFPWQVLISMDNSYVCGGSVISDTWILTAGHCASDFSNFVVTLGAQRSDQQEPGTVVKQTRDKTVHERYDPNQIENDISLLRLPSPISFTHSPGINDQLRYVSMPVMSNDECARTYGDVITNSKICTDTKVGRSSCNCDSGGPLVLMMNDGRYTEVGIVSIL